MADPITISVAAIAVAKFVGESIAGEVIGGEAHHFYREFLERWRESVIGHPRNHDLCDGGKKSIREAAL